MIQQSISLQLYRLISIQERMVGPGSIRQKEDMLASQVSQHLVTMAMLLTAHFGVQIPQDFSNVQESTGQPTDKGTMKVLAIFILIKKEEKEN